MEAISILLLLFGLVLLLLFLCRAGKWLFTSKTSYFKVKFLSREDDLEECFIEPSSYIPEKKRVVLPVLPTELWALVFEYLDSDQDLINCINASPIWEYILAERKTPMLLPRIYPHLVKYLETRDILNCRLVSKKWKTIIDQLLQTHRTYPLKLAHLPEPWRWITTTNISTLPEMRRFSDEMGTDEENINQCKSPFPSGSLKISVDPTLDVDLNTLVLYSGLVQNILTSFGTYLHRFDYHVKAQENVARTLSFLDHLPNLEHLGIHVGFQCTVRYAQIDEEDFRTTALPEMPFLKSLNVQALSDCLLVPVILRALVRRYGEQLWKLECFADFDVTEFHLPDLPLASDLTIIRPTKEFLANISFVRWNLDRLCLNFKRETENELKIGFATIMRVIKNFAETLSELQLTLVLGIKKDYIYLEERKGPNSEALMNVVFPNLKTFEVSDDLMEVVLVQDLVKNFVNLECLVVDMGLWFYEALRARRSNDAQSRFWELCPKLKVIERWMIKEPTEPFIKCKSKCYREGWELELRKNRKRVAQNGIVKTGNVIEKVVELF